MVRGSGSRCGTRGSDYPLNRRFSLFGFGTHDARGELKVRGPFSRARSFEEGGGSEATPGPFFPSRGRLGYSSISSRFSLRIGVRGDFEGDAVQR
jgi:hypothetical protein